MMTVEQQEIIKQVYTQFYGSDSNDREWTTLDTCMEQLSWLSDNQIIIEATVMIDLHASGSPRCTQDHPVEHCFVPVIIDAIGYILSLYAETEELNSKNRFILEYYLAISQEGLILY